MNRLIIALAALAFLSACGVAGAPKRPEPDPSPVRMSFDGYFGYDTKRGMVSGTGIGLHLGG